MKTATGSMDRRSARTRARLRHALNSLIMRKRYEAITIKDICTAAKIGRSTFYGHFTGKDDLKRSCLGQPLRSEIRGRMGHDPVAPRPARHLDLSFSLGMFEHARRYKDHYRALAGGHGGELSLRAIRETLSALVREELAAAGRSGGNAGDAMPREVVVEYVVGAFMAMLIWWLDGGAKLPPQRMDAMFRRLVTDGVFRSE